MRTKLPFIFFLILLFCLASCSNSESEPRRAEVLFLGYGVDNVTAYANWTGIELFKSGINLTYTEDFDDLNIDYLNKYDVLVLFADDKDLSQDQDQAIKRFLEEGKGLAVFNSTANSFKGSAWLNEYISKGFTESDNGDIEVILSDSTFLDRSYIDDFSVHGESYQFEGIPSDAEILATAGNGQAYVWAKKAKKGKVFYSALGREESTWKNINFLRMIRQGVWWSLSDNVKALVEDLEIPHVTIYGDTISDFTARHDVPEMQDPLSPEESMKLIQKPVDFEVKLFASEPDIVNPIAMNWDEKGRLWVIETTDYPNNFVKEGEKGNDRITVCEDTNGDGVADKFTVFADDLNIATSLTFVNDGVLVATAPYFIFLKDTDGDGVADVRDTIMTGWNKNDTHAGPSNLQYGFDNKIYGVTGFAGFDGEINGKRQIFSNGIYSFNPDGSDFEFLAHTSNNTWGLGFSEDNNIFISTANNTHSAFYSMPEKFLQRRVQGMEGNMHVDAVQKIDGHYEVRTLTPNLRQVDVVGGFTSASGHQMYTAREFPQSYWNRVAFVTEPTVRLVHNAIIDRDGAGFKEEDGWNLLASSDEWFGPVHTEVGPDGAVWVLDWYNFIIQHNVFVPEQAPSEKVLPFVDQPHGPGNAFDSDLRDKKHGRVYRVMYKGAKHNESHKLSKSDPKGLLKALKSKNKFWRMHAQRLLVERGEKDVKDKLISLIRNEDVDEIELNAPAIHAIWTLQGLKLLNADEEATSAVIKALKHPSAGVRKAAIQALEVTGSTIEQIAESGIFADVDLNTRMSAFIKLAESEPSSEIASILSKAGNDEAVASDKWLSAAYFAAVQAHENFIDFNSQNDYLKKVSETLQEERYRVGRRARLQFSPNVKDKSIIIESKVDRRDNNVYNGLIIGQGNRQNGYALFMKKNELFWEVYQNGEVYSISTKRGVNESFTVKAALERDKGLSLTVNGQLIDTKQEAPVFQEPLDLYLRSGHDLDRRNRLTRYEGGHEFTGNVDGTDILLVSAKNSENKTEEDVDGTSETEAKVGETIVIKAVKDLLQYDKKEFTVKAGSEVSLTFENPDGMPHNLLIIEPGTLEIVGEAADKMLRANDAAEKEYVPELDEVLFHTPLVNPGGNATIKFTVPDKAGNYPFVCTFPGHWRGMNGIMKVVE